MAEKGGEGWSDQPGADSVGRLRTALDRIAFALDRRKNAVPPVTASGAAGPDLQPVVASIDALMMQIRDVLEHEPAPAVREEDPYGDLASPEYGSAHGSGNFQGGEG